MRIIDEESKKEYWHPDVEGVSLAQNKWVDDALKLLKTYINPSYALIEIGTSHGGFTLLLNQIFPEYQIYTFDLAIPSGILVMSQYPNIHFFQQDSFETNMIVQLIGIGPVVIFCDGGHKANEFNFYAPALKKEDVILGHDYAFSPYEYENVIHNKLWLTDELYFDQIRHNVENKTVYPWLEPEFKKAVWGCFRRA
jgi:hypothetical protein